MQFLTIAALSLSLGSQVLAAPVIFTPTSLTSGLQALPGHVVGGVESVVPAEVTTEVASVTSHLDKRTALIFEVVSAVSTLKSSIHSEFSTIGQYYFLKL